MMGEEGDWDKADQGERSSMVILSYNSQGGGGFFYGTLREISYSAARS